MRGLNYNHLYYFWAVATEGGIARAAEKLHLTPQTISGQIQVLGETLGAELFTRKGRQLVLSETGRVVFSYADEMFRLGAEMRDVVEGRSAGSELTFTVGIVDVVPKLIAYRLLEPALRLEQSVRIVGREGKLEDLLAEVALHKLDMVLADTPIAPGINVRAFNHTLGECGITFFASGATAGRYREDFPRSLDGAPMLLPATNTALRGALMLWMDRLDIHPHVAGEFEDSALMTAFGQAGVGVFIAPAAIEPDIIRQYDVAPIGRTDEVRERFYAISAERRLRHPAVVAIRDAARLEMFS
jgi:LysR family transcriptional activator of nhaA